MESYQDEIVTPIVSPSEDLINYNISESYDDYELIESDEENVESGYCSYTFNTEEYFSNCINWKEVYVSYQFCTEPGNYYWNYDISEGDVEKEWTIQGEVWSADITEKITYRANWTWRTIRFQVDDITDSTITVSGYYDRREREDGDTVYVNRIDGTYEYETDRSGITFDVTASNTDDVFCIIRYTPDEAFVKLDSKDDSAVWEYDLLME